MRRAALFDMDRTLVRKETASLYVKYQRRLGEATLSDAVKVLYWVAEYTLGIIDVEDVAKKVIGQLEGSREGLLTARCETWFEEYVRPHVCEAGVDAVRRHLARGDVVAIVTGASKYATWPLARHLGIDHVVTTEFEVDPQGLFTGRVVAPLCYGTGKIARTQRLADELGFTLSDAIFYSDSLTDLPLLEAVGERVVVNPDPRLRRIARKRGWTIERW